MAWSRRVDAPLLRFLVERSRSSARALFFASIIFLPLILGLMVVTKA